MLKWLDPMSEPAATVVTPKVASAPPPSQQGVLSEARPEALRVERRSAPSLAMPVRGLPLAASRGE